MATEINFNKLDQGYEIINLDNLVQGSKNTEFLIVRFGNYVNGNYVIDTELANNSNKKVGVVYTRSDGLRTWFIPLTPQLDGSFIGAMSGWVFRKSGILKIDVSIKNMVTDDSLPYNRVNQFINEGSSFGDDDWVFTEADYDAMWEAIGIKGSSIVVSENEPQDSPVGQLWYQLLED